MTIPFPEGGARPTPGAGCSAPSKRRLSGAPVWPQRWGQVCRMAISYPGLSTHWSPFLLALCGPSSLHPLAHLTDPALASPPPSFLPASCLSACPPKLTIEEQRRVIHSSVTDWAWAYGSLGSNH